MPLCQAWGGEGQDACQPRAGPLQPQRGRGIHLLHSSCGAAHALEVHGLKGDQLHQTGLTNGRCCEFHYPLSQQRAKGTQRLFPHESGIPAEPWETASHSADWAELGCLVSPHIHKQKYKQAYKGWLWAVYLSCTWFDWTGIWHEMCCLDATEPEHYGHFTFFNMLEEFSVSCSKITRSDAINVTLSDFMPG